MTAYRFGKPVACNRGGVTCRKCKRPQDVGVMLKFLFPWKTPHCLTCAAEMEASRDSIESEAPGGEVEQPKPANQPKGETTKEYILVLKEIRDVLLRIEAKIDSSPNAVAQPSNVVNLFAGVEVKAEEKTPVKTPENEDKYTWEKAHPKIRADFGTKEAFDAYFDPIKAKGLPCW
jgi:hypothetical protein